MGEFHNEGVLFLINNHGTALDALFNDPESWVAYAEEELEDEFDLTGIDLSGLVDGNGDFVEVAQSTETDFDERLSYLLESERDFMLNVLNRISLYDLYTEMEDWLLYLEGREAVIDASTTFTHKDELFGAVAILYHNSQMWADKFLSNNGNVINQNLYAINDCLEQAIESDVIAFLDEDVCGNITNEEWRIACSVIVSLRYYVNCK